MSFDNADWSSWMCQILGLTLPPLVQYGGQVCVCGRHTIDRFGDHVHTCKKYGRNRSDAHQILLKALQAICQRAGYTSEIKNVPASNGKRRADLFIQRINLAGMEDMVVDVSMINDFHGDMIQDVRRNDHHRRPPPPPP